MANYTAKPVAVQALPFDGAEATATAIIDWMATFGAHANFNAPTLEITTPNGILPALRGDYVIQDVSGAFWPCKPATFEAMYSPA